ncbi:metaxin-1 isoform X2 [Cephus cinctus]|uniref:Metaxin-1 isoform X2 n=1 Tax=Cephus cinctus TaxID=211228 RepID=A0AAJ7C412_CEPCN|nr:metaxin-1 isoform X2 [Cephus cinctus]
MVEYFRLDVWKGDWGLPSVDSPSLQILAYAKFSGVPLDVHATNNPFRTPNGQLPVLRSGLNTLDSINDIIALFKQKNYNADISLTPRQCAEIVAYDTMIREKIYPALQYIWWIDQRNVNDLIRPWYAKAVPFPLNFYYHGKYEAQAKSMMESLYPTEDNNAVIENGVYSEAQKCLTLLSTRLGESEFFCGSQPTSFDAIVYSYLAPLLKAPLPNPALQNHLKACTNLAKFVSRISQRYFGDIHLEYEKEKAEENARKTRRDSESEFPNKRRNQFFAGVVAVLAMLGYALSSGVVKVTIKDDEMLEAASEYILDDQDTAD